MNSSKIRIGNKPISTKQIEVDILCQTQRGCTVWLISTARFSVHILLLHHYESDLAHISNRYSSGIGMYRSEMLAKNN